MYEEILRNTVIATLLDTWLKGYSFWATLIEDISAQSWVTNFLVRNGLGIAKMSL